MQLKSEIESYTNRLRNADWLYQYSDDGQVYRYWRDQFKELRAIQSRIDPDKLIWKIYERK